MVLQLRPAGLVIRSAKPGGFIAGGGIGGFRGITDAAKVEAEIARGHAVLDRLDQLPLPTIAVIHGYCLGCRLEVALACDHRIAIEGASFGFPEVVLVPASRGVRHGAHAAPHQSAVGDDHDADGAHRARPQGQVAWPCRCSDAGAELHAARLGSGESVMYAHRKMVRSCGSGRVGVAVKRNGPPDLGSNNAGWTSMGNEGGEFIAVPGSPSPVTNDPAHPFVPNGLGKQPTFRVAAIENPNLTQFARDGLRQANEDVLRGKAVFSRESRVGLPAFRTIFSTPDRCSSSRRLRRS
jgi:hypothetical protein